MNFSILNLFKARIMFGGKEIIYLEVKRQSYIEGYTEKDLPSTGFLPKGHNSYGQATMKPETRNSFQVSHGDTGTQVLGSSLTAFSGTFVGS